MTIFLYETDLLMSQLTRLRKEELILNQFFNIDTISRHKLFWKETLSYIIYKQLPIHLLCFLLLPSFFLWFSFIEFGCLNKECKEQLWNTKYDKTAVWKEIVKRTFSIDYCHTAVALYDFINMYTKLNWKQFLGFNSSVNDGNRACLQFVVFL